jgi:hypothetical protein
MERPGEMETQPQEPMKQPEELMEHSDDEQPVVLKELGMEELQEIHRHHEIHRQLIIQETEEVTCRDVKGQSRI